MGLLSGIRFICCILLTTLTHARTSAFSLYDSPFCSPSRTNTGFHPRGNAAASAEVPMAPQLRQKKQLISIQYSKRQHVDIFVAGHLNMIKQDFDGDDGWYDNLEQQQEQGATKASRNYSDDSSKSTEKEKELSMLRSEMKYKREMVSDGEKNENNTDLFIPLFAVVSLAGLFGAYGYEMIRLYSRGELYLPWD